MSAANQLYQEVILDHNRKPRNWGKLEHASHHAEGLNPLCGDHIFVYLRLRDASVEAIGFEGQSCAICKASASMMTQSVKGKRVDEAETLAREFREMALGKLDPSASGHHLGRLTVFSGVRDLPTRVKCAILPWHTLHSALHSIARASTEGDADPVPGSGLERAGHA
ncbi:MAG: SUF system NifU family Fe-S cluster assembly protein [Burkholderiales bacterium]|nr:SUF system NifU family Fe-S cluster assembly protein [Burkholderiales bacterium]